MDLKLEQVLMWLDIVSLVDLKQGCVEYKLWSPTADLGLVRLSREGGKYVVHLIVLVWCGPTGSLGAEASVDVDAV